MEAPFNDLHFNNVQLLKLVSSAEILFQHLYDLVSVENKVFIDQWFCYKQEYDETCSSHSQPDVENIPECSVLAPIDEVSENEKLTSISSSTDSSSESCVSMQKSDNNKNYIVVDDNKEDEKNVPSEIETQLSQCDLDLSEYMNEFKFFTDDFIFNWFKSLTFNTAEIQEYLNWLQNKEYKRIWASLYSTQKQNGLIDEETIKNNLLDNNNNFEPNNNVVEIGHLKRNINKFSNVNKPENNVSCMNCNNHRNEPIDRQIRHLQGIRQVLLTNRENYNHKFKKDEMKTSTEFKRSLKIDVAFEIVDTAIEIKNRIMLGYDVQDLCVVNDEVDSVIADCLRILSLKEIRYLLMMYLRNVIEMRKCSSECDKQLLKLDSEISNQKFLIWRLYMMINENKRSYENQCLTLHKEFEQKLQLMGKTTTDESNDSAMESIAGLQGRKLLSIIERNDVPESSHSDLRDTRDSQHSQPMVPMAPPNIPEKSLKTLQSTSATSSGMKVSRNKKKIIIQTQKR